MASRFRSSRVHFNFLGRLSQPAPGLMLENNGAVEHKGFNWIAWLVIAVMLVVVALTAHGMANAINPSSPN